VRTLVISDIHLGQGGGVSVLERPRPLAKLLAALDSYDRLVLLGDTVEMQETHSSISFPIAEPILRAVAERLGPEKRLVLVAGNHDHGLVREWTQAQGSDLALESVVPADASPALARVVSWLQATQVEVRYPGLWLADGVWATHGHYLNNYLRPVSSWGLHRRTRLLPAAPAAFEYIPHRPAPPHMRDAIPPAPHMRDAIPPAPHMRDGLPPARWLDRHIPSQLAPLTARVLGKQMQRHALPAFARSVQALGVEAEWVIFGHVHRRGPREGDNPELWSAPGGSPRILNTGSWRYEPVVVHGGGHQGGYWPGGAVTLDDDGIPRSVGLLDELTEAELLSGD
jgi:UDP-2,3-diacylglucosamine pyrophosphatase LpxH